VSARLADSRWVQGSARATHSVFITGTGTGVGKTVLCGWIIRRLIHHGVIIRAFKPLCSGGREDARALWHAQRRNLPLDVINPWWFTAPVTPLAAARASGIHLKLAQVIQHLNQQAPKPGVLLVEGAGGLLSPLGEDFTSRELIRALEAQVIIVAVNRLGVINEAWLTWEALPAPARALAHWVLFDPPAADASTSSNAELLASRIDARHIHHLPRSSVRSLRKPQGRLADQIDALLSKLGLLPARAENG